MSELEITIETLEDNIVLIKPSGYLDAHTFEQLDCTIQEIFENQTHRLIVNLEEVNYISSAGAGVFIGAISQAHENSGNIIFLSPSPNVQDVFDLLGLSQIFSFASQLEEALEKF
ncbi:MAG: STAS domain-containing protein [Planctomycetota bacterium]|nr:STAS domain-containing protein [Planctomycetota bacterium]